MNRIVSVVVVLIYNIIGFIDILSTEYALVIGAGQEANPLMKAAMDGLAWDQGWVAIKLALQFTVSAMVLWFPHKIVMTLFSFVVVTNGLVVLKNLMIGGLI